MILLPTITDTIQTPYWLTFPLATNAHDCLDDDNGDTSYCVCSHDARYMILGFANPDDVTAVNSGVAEADIDISAGISVRFLSSGRSTSRRGASLLDIDYETPSGNPTESCSYDPHASSYETINGTARSDADGSSGGWSYSDLENLEMRCTKNSTRQLRLSYLALEVTYTEAVSADNATFFGANF